MTNAGWTIDGERQTGAAISVRHVEKAFALGQGAGRLTVLEDVSFEVRGGEFLVIVGPSGCGKTTLLDLLAGLSRPDTGDILLNGKPVRGPGLDRGIVLQQYTLFPWRTALGNIEFGLEAKGLPRAERRDRARHYLDLVGLGEFGDLYPHQLSGGMKQRTAIARALSFDPNVLLMDESFAALDAMSREALQEELRHIWQQTGKTVVFITHSIEEAVYLGQRVMVMTARPGRVIADIPVTLGPLGADEDLRAAPEFVRLRHEIWQLIHGQGGTDADKRLALVPAAAS
jgi:NitT/TauT family transport system ATP-binding protein